MHRAGKVQRLKRSPADRPWRSECIGAGNWRTADPVAQLERLRRRVIIVPPLFAGVADGEALHRTEGIILKAHTVSQAASAARAQRTQGTLRAGARARTVDGPGSRRAG